MAVSFTAYDSAGTSLGTVAPSAASWTHDQGEDGSGQLTALGDLASAILAETSIIRVNDGTSDIFAFVPTTKTRRQVELSTELDLSGPGVRWLLHAGQVLQEDTSDCAEPSGTRWFGWMSDEYDSSSWAAVASHGTFTSEPFVTSRPEGWPDPTAEYLWSSTLPNPGNGEVYFRRTFAVAEDTDVLVMAAADDEYRLFLNGTEILSTWGGGPLQWQRYQQRPMRICAGNHTLAIVGKNLERPFPQLNYGWIIASIMPVDASGSILEQNQKWNVYHDHSGGTFTLTVSGAQTTSAIAYNASTATIQSALEALSNVGAGNVTVSGSNTLRNNIWEVSHDHTGGTFTLTARGGTTAAIAYNATAAAVEAALEAVTEIGDNVTVTGAGTSGDPWRIEFDNNLTLTSVTLTGSGASLTGGTTFDIVEDQTALNDPWVVEFDDSMANIYVLLEGNGSSLTGGTALEVDEAQRGQSGHPLVRTDNSGSWKCLAYPATPPGLTPGEVLRIAMEEAQARGTTVLDDISLGFTDSVDSDGNAWSSTITFPMSLPGDIHRLAVIVEELGFAIEMTPDLTLECWDDRGSDLSDTVSLEMAFGVWDGDPMTWDGEPIAWGSVGATDVVSVRDETTVANVLRAFTGEGWTEDTDTTSITARGRWESGMSLDGFPTGLDATLVTGPLLDEYASPPRTTTLTIPSEAAVVPYDDFGMADIVSASAFGESGFETADMRVISLGGRMEELSIVWTVGLVD